MAMTLTADDENLAIYGKLQKNTQGKSKDKTKPLYIIWKIKKHPSTKKEGIFAELVMNGEGLNEETKDDSESELERISVERHKAFCKDMMANAPCYGTLDFKDKIFFVSYSDENNCTVRQKMRYSSSRENFKNQLRGIHNNIQATDAGELAYKEFNSKIKSV